MKIIGGFSFGKMFFKYELDADGDLFIEGKDKQAKTSLECDHFNDAIYSHVRLNILKEEFYK